MSLTSATKTVGNAAESLIPTPTSGDYSLYYHIPFCTKKCPYCHFFVLPDHEPSKTLLLSGLRQEFSIISPFGNLKSIYFGGGTPSLFGPERVKEVINFSKDQITKETEITLEVNPEGVTYDLIKAYKESGINRISLGVQSFDEGQLIQLGRTHSASYAETAINLIKQAGIDNISIDLMYDLPSQTLQEWERTLNKATTLPITHLSLYNLTIEPTSLFFKTKSQLEKVMPDSELSEQMYRLAQKILNEGGLKQYEISAFAKDSQYSVHNTGYWLGRTFWGLGPSAFSFVKGERFRNVAHLKKYIEKLDKKSLPIDFRETLTADASARELFAIAIRLLQGATFNPSDEELVKNLHYLEKHGLVTLKDNHCALTTKGILLYDTVGSEII